MGGLNDDRVVKHRAEISSGKTPIGFVDERGQPQLTDYPTCKKCGTLLTSEMFDDGVRAEMEREYVERWASYGDGRKRRRRNGR